MAAAAKPKTPTMQQEHAVEKNDMFVSGTEQVSEAFKHMTVEELTGLQHKLADYLKGRTKTQEKAALGRIREIVQKYDLKFDDVLKEIRTVAVRGKAPAIYQNPANPRQTWSGKGEAPTWFEKAKDKEALRI